MGYGAGCLFDGGAESVHRGDFIFVERCRRRMRGRLAVLPAVRLANGPVSRFLQLK